MTRFLAPGSGFEILNYPEHEELSEDGSSFKHITPEAQKRAKEVITLIRENRCKFISGCVDVEKYLGEAIAKFFFEDEIAKREMFHLFVLDTTLFSFSQKRKLLQRIMENNQDKFESLTSKSRQEMFDNINDLIKIRNAFAHGETIIDFKTEHGYIRYFDSITNQKAELILSPDFFKQLDTRVSKAIVNLLPFIPEPKFSIMRRGDFS
jgi:hypothetical protein